MMQWGHTGRKPLAMTPQQHAEALVRVFRGYVAMRDDLVNRENLRVATEWLRLLNQEEPTDADVESLASSLESLGWAGSATLDLQLGVGARCVGASRSPPCDPPQDRASLTSHYTGCRPPGRPASICSLAWSCR